MKRASLLSFCGVLLCSASSAFAAPGDLDITFGPGGNVAGGFTSIAVQADGKILAVGGQAVRRFLPNGSVDSSFGSSGQVIGLSLTISSAERSLTVQPDGKILLAGVYYSNVAVARLNPDGSLDEGFGQAGMVHYNIATYNVPSQDGNPAHAQYGLGSDDQGFVVGALPGGVIVAAGVSVIPGNWMNPAASSMVAFVVLNPDGSKRTSDRFAEGISEVNSLSVLPAGDAILAGWGSGGGFLLTMNSEGGTGGGGLSNRSLQPSGVAAGSDGALWVTGTSGAEFFAAGVDRTNLKELGNPKIFGAAAGGKSVAIQPDGRVVVIGEEFARYLPDGSPDTTFQPAPHTSGRTLAIQSDGKILVAGSNSLRRYEGSGESGEIVVEQPAGTPLISGQSVVDFGSVSVGASASRTFTIRNTALVSLNVYGLNIDGSPAGPLSAAGTFPVQLAPGAQTSTIITWKPPTHGPLMTSLRITNADPDEHLFDIALTGTAIAVGPEVEVKRDHVKPLINGAHTIQLSHFRPEAELTISNAGDEPLNIASLHFEGADAASFSISRPPVSVIEPGVSDTVAIRFIPGPESALATLRLVSNDANESPFEVNMIASSITSSDLWREAWFGNPDADGPGYDLNDPDHDGIPNLLEYATSSSPLQAGGPAGELVKNGNVLEYTIIRPKDAPAELDYALEWTESLTNGPWKKLGITTTVVSEDSAKQQVKFSLPAGVSGQRFVRLRVTRK
ncbi:MAG TPA: choice-of-anchor D domain-containing protein [Verrucomicrobiales bacterium]|nr:choice-of-anchor D domain-containing protein [Verrucomicrobiales bacterium]